jgi:HEAT repeat protein
VTATTRRAVLRAGVLAAMAAGPRSARACGQDAGSAAAALAYWTARLGDPDPAIRALAAGALGETRSMAAVTPLGRALDDPDPAVRLAALRGLARVGPLARAAAPAVRRLVQSGPPDLREEAERTLARLEGP